MDMGLYMFGYGLPCGLEVDANDTFLMKVAGTVFLGEDGSWMLIS